MFTKVENINSKNFPIFENGELWEIAFSQAQRSTLKAFKTGAVVFDRKGNIIGKGCSHIAINSRGKSTHAEEHAIHNAGKHIEQAKVLIVTIGRSGNPAFSSRPCFTCVRMMKKYLISEIIYPERLNDGTWIINKESPTEMWNRSLTAQCKKSLYAREMRIPKRTFRSLSN